MLCPGSRSSSTARVPIQASSKPTTTHGRFEHGTAGLSMSWACSPRRRRGDVLLEVEEARRAPHGRLRAHDDARPAPRQRCTAGSAPTTTHGRLEHALVPAFDMQYGGMPVQRFLAYFGLPEFGNSTSDTPTSPRGWPRSWRVLQE
jgi:hypothetical protein